MNSIIEAQEALKEEKLKLWYNMSLEYIFSKPPYDKEGNIIEETEPKKK